MGYRAIPSSVPSWQSTPSMSQKGQVMLAVDDLEPAGYHTVVLAPPETYGRSVVRQLPVHRFLEDPSVGVEVFSYVLVYDVAGIPLPDSPFAGGQTGYLDIRLFPDLSTLRPYPGVSGAAICLADAAVDSGAQVPFAPRAVLRGQVESARDAGFEVRLATELEFYLFQNGPREARQLGFRGLEPTTPALTCLGRPRRLARRWRNSRALTSSNARSGRRWSLTTPPTLGPSGRRHSRRLPTGN